jgi:hypothetical protein
VLETVSRKYTGALKGLERGRMSMTYGILFVGDKGIRSFQR